MEIGESVAFPQRIDGEAVPALHCQRGPAGWCCGLRGWDAAPPGFRLAAEMLGTVLADAAARVEQLAVLSARERERQLQARLAELGSLAATVAHGIRKTLGFRTPAEMFSESVALTN